MKRLFVTMLAAMAAMFVASPAMAQATRTWVSGVGDDVNPCSRTAPCKTFAGAISKTDDGGEIDCLDPGGFGTVTITKSITLDCTGTMGSVLGASSTSGINVNDSAGTIKVVLRGLSINGTGTTPGTIGVRVQSARDVLIIDSIISNFSTAGIQINTPTRTAVTVKNSTLTKNGIGVQIISPGGNSAARVYNSLIAPSGTVGISVSGTGNLADISADQITRSPKSLEILSGGVINSYGDNVLSPGDAPTIVPKG